MHILASYCHKSFALSLPSESLCLTAAETEQQLQQQEQMQRQQQVIRPLAQQLQRLQQ
jgi:hypothetical protein